MNKPEWKDAPAWASYLAMDEDGIWWWYEQKPYLENSFWDSHGRRFRVNDTSWKDTLESRQK